jgi:hypothetical protein
MKLKSNIAYVIFPLLALALFTPYYLHFSSHFDEMKQQEADRERQARADKIEADNKLKAKAIEEANIAADQRKKDRERKEEEKAREEEEEENLMQARDHARQDVFRAHDKVGQLTRDVATIQDEIKKVEDDEARLRQERGFLVDYVSKTEQNRQSLSAVLDKIAAADAAARAALEAASKK